MDYPIRPLLCGVLFCIAVCLCGCRTSSESYSYKPASGYVPDEATAISIAQAVWGPIYGKEKIESEKPFVATLKDGVWSVSGTLPKGRFGGVANIEISKDSGKILKLWHEL